jgi:integrase/recombinase XerC
MNEISLVPTPPAGIATRHSDTLRAMADDFFGSLSPRTRATYQSNLTAFARFVGAASIPEAIETLTSGGAGAAFTTLSRWKTDLLASGLSGATVNSRMGAVRSMLGFANDCGRIAWRVKVRKASSESKSMRGPSPQQMQALFAACSGVDPMAVRDMALLRLLYNTALRRAEACSLGLEDIHFDRRVMSVLRKGHSVRVDVAMPSTVEQALRAWIAVRGAAPGALLHNFDPTNKASPALTGDGVTNILHRLAKAAGLDHKKVRPHGLRHSGITRALKAMNGNITKVMAFSGHKSAAMVIRYNDEQNELAREVAAAVEALDDAP